MWDLLGFDKFQNSIFQKVFQNKLSDLKRDNDVSITLGGMGGMPGGLFDDPELAELLQVRTIYSALYKYQYMNGIE